MAVRISAKGFQVLLQVDFCQEDLEPATQTTEASRRFRTLDGADIAPVYCNTVSCLKNLVQHRPKPTSLTSDYASLALPYEPNRTSFCGIMTSNKTRTPSRNWQRHLPILVQTPILDLHIRLYNVNHERAALTRRRAAHELHV